MHFISKTSIFGAAIICFGIFGCNNKLPAGTSGAQPSQMLWDSLLQAHVTHAGSTDYSGFIRDSLQLNKYLEQLSSHVPDEQTWSKNEILSYWINAYNAYTVQLVIRHYPLESIKDIKKGIPFINSAWDIDFISTGKEMISLNTIEHRILRKMDEPRIHFAINCASRSCPVLYDHAYTAAQLNHQLDEQTRRFINDPSKNIIAADHASLSTIFSWFTSDFTKNGSLRDFINQYSVTTIAPDASIDFMDYNWELNDVQ